MVTVAAISACALGIPLNKPASKPSSEPFPCMNCPCGCNTAEVCWRNCCCFSQQEKLAWARDNGVTPPAYVLAAANASIKAARQSGCCKNKAKHSCCSSRSKQKCCSSKRVCSKQRQTGKKTRRSTAPTILVVHALRCQGLTASLTALPPTVIPLQSALNLTVPPVGKILFSNDLLKPGPFSAPDTPPPQYFA